MISEREAALRGVVEQARAVREALRGPAADPNLLARLEDGLGRALAELDAAETR